MKSNLKILFVLVLFIAVFLALYSVMGKKSLAADRLYALKLNNPPAEYDWENAVALNLTARNGNFHELHKSVDVDKDAVHTSTASCHHALPEAPPVAVTLKAYYTDSELFIRIKWRDLTMDDELYQYDYSDGKWNVTDKLEDGIGIMWDLTEGDEPFTCSVACHTTDWKLKDYSLISKFKMATIGSTMVDLWSWKAFRTNIYNFADDKYISSSGIVPDTPSRIYFYNSVELGLKPLDESARDIKPLEDGSTPAYDSNGLAIKDGYWLLSGTAPGVKVIRPTGNRADIDASGEYRCGSWVVTFSRKLVTEDGKDVTFVVKRTNTYKFGVAVMDNTLTNHYAIEEPITLEFVDGNASSS